MTVLGAIFATAALVAFLIRRDYYLWVMSAAAAFPTSAAVLIGDYAISPFHMLGIPLVAALALDRRRVTGPGRQALYLFAAWTALVTITAPVLQQGVRVLTPDLGIETGLAAPQTLAFGASQIGQLAYLVIGLSVVVAVSRRGPWSLLPAPGLALAVLLALSELIAINIGASWPHDFFDNGAVTYLDSEYDGRARLRGAMAEASLLGEISVAALGYFAVLAVTRRGLARWGWTLLASSSLLVAIASASGAAAAALLVVAVVALAVVVIRVLRRGRAAGALIFGVPAVVILAIVYGATAYTSVAAFVEDKLSSQSGTARGASNDFSLQVVIDSFGLGVGIGSHRPSSFAWMLLACTGLVGTALFAAAVWWLGRAAGGPLAAALVGALAAKVAAAADLSAPYLWVLLGACASVAWQVRPGSGDRERDPAQRELPGVADSRHDRPVGVDRDAAKRIRRRHGDPLVG